MLWQNTEIFCEQIYFGLGLQLTIMLEEKICMYANSEFTYKGETVYEQPDTGIRVVLHKNTNHC